MIYQITNAGLNAVSHAQAGGPKVTITAYKLGSAAGYIPNAAQTALVGTVLYSGLISNYAVNNANECEYTINLDETVGDFTFGEVGLYLDTGELFAVSSLVSAQPKTKSTTVVAGNYIAIKPKLILAGIVATINFPITQVVAAQYVEIASLDLLQPPIASNSNAYLCHNNDDGGNPVLAFRNTDTKWSFSTHPNMIVSGSVSAFALTTPAAPTLAVTAGSLPAGNYSYRITAINSVGESLASAPAAQTIGGGSGITISWTPLAGATGYKVYGRTPNGEQLLFTVNETTFSIVDTGSVTTPIGNPPTTNTTGVSTPSSIVSQAIARLLNNVQAGKFIIQFTSGVNKGYCRVVSTSSPNKLSVANFFGSTPAAGDTFEIYKSSYSFNLENPLAQVPGAINNTSSSVNTVTSGDLTFVVDTVLAYTAGLFLMIIPVAQPSAYIWGHIKQWDPVSKAVVVTVDKTSGTATQYNKWTLSITGPSGVQGPAGVSSGNLKVTVNDQNLDYLGGKLVIAAPLKLGVVDSGLNEKLRIEHDISGVVAGYHLRNKIDERGHVIEANNDPINLSTEVTGKLNMANLDFVGTGAGANQFLSGDGSFKFAGLSWVTTAVGGNAQAATGYLTDTAGGTFTMVMPTNPPDGTIVAFADDSGTWDTKPVILDRNGQNFMGFADNITLDIKFDKVAFVFKSGKGWRMCGA